MKKSPGLAHLKLDTSSLEKQWFYLAKLWIQSNWFLNDTSLGLEFRNLIKSWSQLQADSSVQVQIGLESVLLGTTFSSLMMSSDGSETKWLCENIILLKFLW